MPRLFAAIAIPSEIGLPLQARQCGIPGARWHALEALHITLRFFGEVSDDIARDLALELERVIIKPLDLTLVGAGCFGEGNAINAVWIGVESNPALLGLARACEAAARRAGLPPERRNYRPHVTLAYLKRPDPARVASWIAEHNLTRSPTFGVTGFGLYSSLSGSTGPIYRLEQDYRTEI